MVSNRLRKRAVLVVKQSATRRIRQAKVGRVFPLVGAARHSFVSPNDARHRRRSMAIGYCLPYVRLCRPKL